MLTPEQIEELNRFDRLIQDWAKKFGLDCYPQEFDIIDSEKMAELMTSGNLPTTFNHWSYGRDFEAIKTAWRLNRANLPMEVVYNANPSRGYICGTDPFVVMLLVMAHVYGHNDFFKNNFWLLQGRKDMLGFMADAARRFKRYEDTYGVEAVEKTLTAALALQWNIEPFRLERPDFQEQIEAKILETRAKAKKDQKTLDLKKLRTDLEKQIPFEPDRDIIGFLKDVSPTLEDWQRDILAVVRERAHYLFPNFRTKTMNEGWAVYWHENIMDELIKAKLISNADRDIYMDTQSKVLADWMVAQNPYWLGREIWKHIIKKHGLKKAFDVRANYRDIEFVEEFLEDELIRQLKLYIYERYEDHIDGQDVYVYEIADKNPKRVRERIVDSLKKIPDAPVIRVTRSNFNKEGELLLLHDFNEEQEELDPEHLAKTLEHVYHLWGKPVWLQTREINLRSSSGFASILYGYDGIRHNKLLI